MCGRYALYGPISRHRKNKPIDDLPDWYPSIVDAINARPMRFNVAPTEILEESAWSAWLAGEAADAADVLRDAQEPQLTYYPVPKAVGSPKNDTPDLVERVEG